MAPVSDNVKIFVEFNLVGNELGRMVNTIICQWLVKPSAWNLTYTHTIGIKLF
jgi:hypothetical protein